MLDVFREGAKTWVSRFFVWMIAMTFVAAAFVVWGTQGEQKASAAANVGGEEISRAQLYQRAKMIESNLRQQLGGQMDANLLSSLDPESMALDALIEEALMRQAALDAGVRVGDEETRDAIMGMKEFLTDGIFDRRKYQEILKLNGYSVADFERSISQGLLAERFRSLAQRPVTVSNAEALDAYLQENQPLVAEYAEVAEGPLRLEVKPAEAEVRDWFGKRKLDFERPARRKMRIMTAHPSTFELSVSVSEEEARKYFEANQAEFEAKEQVEASHILAKVSAGAPAEADKAAREKVEKALARVLAGEDFSAVAKEASEDATTAQSGGSLGRFSRGQMVQAFENVVFALKAGEISAPFKTPFGWHIVKSTGKIGAGTPSFEASRDLAFIKAKKRKAAEEAFAAITKASVNLTAQNFDERAAADKRLRVESLSLTRADMIPDVEEPEKLMETLFSMQKGTVSEVISLPDGYAAMALDDVIDAHTPPFEEIKPAVEAKFIGEKARQMAKEKADLIAKQAVEGKTLAEAAAAVGLTVKTTPPFTQSQLRDPQQGGREPGMVAEAFLLKPGEVRSSPALGGYIAFTAKERQKVDFAKAAGQMESIRGNLLRLKRERVLAGIVRDLRKQAEARNEIHIFINQKKGA